MNLHRMRNVLTSAGPALTLALAALLGPVSLTASAALLKPGATQSFPDIAGSLNSQLSYQFDPAKGIGTLSVLNAPAILAIGPNTSSESYVYDPAGGTRGQTLKLQLDSGGNLMTADAGNTFSMYGSVTVNGKNYSGLLLQGTPVAFGYADPSGMPKGTAAFDVNVNLTGGLLKQAYGPDAYVRISPEIGSSFTGSFAVDFKGDKAWTNVRAYNAPTPSPIPEPSTFAILLACGGAAAAYRRRKGAHHPSDL